MAEDLGEQPYSERRLSPEVTQVSHLASGFSVNLLLPDEIFDQADLQHLPTRYRELEISSTQGLGPLIDRESTKIGLSFNVSSISSHIYFSEQARSAPFFGYYDPERVRKVQEILKEQGLNAESLNAESKFHINKGEVWVSSSVLGSKALLPGYEESPLFISLKFGSTSRSAEKARRAKDDYYSERPFNTDKVDDLSNHGIEVNFFLERQHGRRGSFTNALREYARIYEIILNALYLEAGLEPPEGEVIIRPEGNPETGGIRQKKETVLEPEPDTRRSIKDIFEQAEARKPRHSYFINGELKNPDLSAEDLKKLESTVATFIEVRIQSDGSIRYQVSPFAIPYLFEDVAQSAEFTSALNFAGQEFRLFALCSSSASGTEKQAKLYEIVADVITKCHENNPMLLMEWGRIQTSNQGDLTSFDALRTLDYKFENGKTIPRDGNEQLIIFGGDGQGGYDISKFEKAWAGKISQLRRVLDNGKLERHHMRQLEFLSCSVNIHRLFDQYLKGTATSQT